MGERTDGCSGEPLLASCTRKKRLQRKATVDFTGYVLKKILAYSVSGEMTVSALFTCLCIED